RAGIGRRMAALMIDSVIVAIVVVPIGFLIQQSLENLTNEGVGWLSASSVAMLLYIAYFTLLEGQSGATFGKRLLSLRVQRLHGGQCTMRESLIRNALRVIDGFPFFFAPGVPPLYLAGGVFIMYSPHRQRLGDWAADTVVVLAHATEPVQRLATTASEPAGVSGRKRRRR
ncbi:MAG TPA: RDD family protein, partial [Thermomicrobiales bacterium]|nr:RDD family protein [Thermomicrobiales bacterium]